MKNSKRLLALGLAGAMLGLTACGSSAPAASEAASDTTAAASEAPAEEAASEAPAEEAASGEIVQLKWLTVGGGMPANYDEWIKQFNDYIGPKTGVNIDIEVTPWGDWQQKRTIAATTGADYDILFTDQTYFYNDVKTGALLDITDKVKSVAPTLYGMMPEDYWKAVSVDGKIYAVPTYKDSSISLFTVWDNTLAQKSGVDPTTVSDWAGMNDAVYKLQPNTDGTVFPMYSSTSGNLYLSDYDMLGTTLRPMGIKVGDDSGKVVYTLEQPDVMEKLKYAHQWYLDGIINSDAATKPEVTEYKPLSIGQGWAGAAKTVWGPQMGMDDCVAVQLGQTTLSNTSVMGSMNCITAASAHPDEALKFLEFINTDTEARDMLFYGVEGEDKDWYYTDDKLVHRNNTDWTMAGYTQATFFKISQTDDVDFNQWDEVKELNEKAVPSLALGFSFDSSSVEDQLTNCNTIWEKYRAELLSGTADPEVAVPAMKEELEGAGFNDILAEAQKQLDAFLGK